MGQADCLVPMSLCFHCLLSFTGRFYVASHSWIISPLLCSHSSHMANSITYDKYSCHSLYHYYSIAIKLLNCPKSMIYLTQFDGFASTACYYSPFTRCLKLLCEYFDTYFIDCFDSCSVLNFNLPISFLPYWLFL